MRLAGSSFGLAFAFASACLALLASGCVARARMCTATSDCAGSASACVAGRCQLDKPTVRPTVDSARRIVVRPVDVAYVQRGDGASAGGLPPVFALGKDGGKLFLKFASAVPKGVNVVEAYLILRRSSLVDDDPAPISLHATRIVEDWSGGSVSWARAPRTTETRSPSTTIEPGTGPLVRLDVRDLVRHWARRDRDDHGIAVVAENETRTGTMFALSGIGIERIPADPSAMRSGLGLVSSSASVTFEGFRSSSAPDVEPYLELYLR